MVEIFLTAVNSTQVSAAHSMLRSVWRSVLVCFMVQKLKKKNKVGSKSSHDLLDDAQLSTLPAVDQGLLKEQAEKRAANEVDQCVCCSKQRCYPFVVRVILFSALI